MERNYLPLNSVIRSMSFILTFVGQPYHQLLIITPDPEAERQPISDGEGKIILKGLNTSKATSKEDFPAWVSTSGCKDMCIPVQNILNCMLFSREYPDTWKRAQVKPAPKTQSPSSYKEYRLIYLLFHLGKVAEQVIVNKVRSRVDEIVNQQQYAYQPLVSTTDALLHLADDWTSILDQQTSVKFIQNAYLDFSKAFDRLDHSTLTFTPPCLSLYSDGLLPMLTPILSLYSDRLTSFVSSME